MARRVIESITSVGIIYRATNPAEIFLEAKDDGLPVKLFRRGLCPIGGNWIGGSDRGPLNTFRRELEEELTLDALSVSWLRGSFSLMPGRRVPVGDSARALLTEVKRVIKQDAVPFGDCLNVTPKAVLDRADPDNQEDGFATLTTYWAIPIGNTLWATLVGLQAEFGNLSNESITLITSLDEILDNKIRFAYAHDRAYQRFFLAMGLARARQMTLIEGIEHELVGTSLPTYDDYLERFDVARRP